MQKTELIEQFEELICPWLIGNEFAKKVIALQMFSHPISDDTPLHVMMIGDPSSGKSDILEFVSKCVPNSGMTSKKVTPEGMNEKLVSANGGILSIDEFGRINKQCREMCLETMSQRVVSIDKFGVHIKKEAKTNLLVGLNPVGDVLQLDEPLYTQTRFSLVLLSRFSILIPFKQIDKDFYADVAMSHYQHKKEEIIEKSTREIRDYIMSARQQVPIVMIPEELIRDIGNCIRDLKNISMLSKIISPRTIEGFKSCLLARARMKFRNKVNKEDFEYVKKIFNVAYK